MSEISGSIFREDRSDKKREKKSDTSKDVGDNHISYKEFMKIVKKTRIMPPSYKNFPHFHEKPTEQQIGDIKVRKKKGHIDNEQTFDMYSGDISNDNTEESNKYVSYKEFLRRVKKTRVTPLSSEGLPNFGVRSLEHPLNDIKAGKKKVEIETKQTFDMHSGDINVDKAEESNKHVSYEDFLRRVKKTRITPLSTESLPNFEMKPQEQIIKDSTGAKKKVEDDKENILVFKSKDEEKNSEKSDNISKKIENKTKKESIKKSDKKVKEEKSKVEEEKKKEIKNSKEERLVEKQRSKEINREKEKSEEEIKSESSSVNKEKKELTSEKQKSQEIKKEQEKMDQKQEKEKEENWNEILRKRTKEERKKQEGEKEEELNGKQSGETEEEQIWNDPETEGMNSDILKLNNESNDIESIRTEINKVEPLKERIKEEQNQEGLREGLKVGLEGDISKHTGEGDFKNFEISKDFFYKLGRDFHCKDIESLKKLYEKLKSFHKVELYLKNQDCKNIPSSYTIKRLVQKSFESKMGYKTWRSDIRLREVQDIAKEKGGKCLSSEYKNSHSKLSFRCKNGHEFEFTPAKVKFQDKWCPICKEEATFFYKLGRDFHCKDVESLKKLYEKLKSFHKVELSLKNQDYKNVPGSYTIKRLVQESFVSKLGYKTWRSDIRLREVRDIAKERGGKCLSTEYKNNRTKLRFRCKNGHEFEMTQLNVKFDHWCPTCAGVKKLTFEEFQEIARKRGGECLSTEYKNNYTKLKFQCKNGHEFEAVPDKVKNQEQWCPICSERAGERICRGLFEAIFKEDFKKNRPEWLKNSEGHQLELDGYNDELKLAFERQGEQHYEFPNYFFKTIKEFISQLSNDQQKEELCETHGVTLIEVPYWIKYGEYQDYIIKQCKAKGIEVPEIKLKIDWKKFKWDTDDDSNSSLKEWM